MSVFRNYRTHLHTFYPFLSLSCDVIMPCGQLGKFQHHTEGTAPPEQRQRPVSQSVNRLLWQVTDTPVKSQYNTTLVVESPAQGTSVLTAYRDTQPTQSDVRFAVLSSALWRCKDMRKMNTRKLMCISCIYSQDICSLACMNHTDIKHCTTSLHTGRKSNMHASFFTKLLRCRSTCSILHTSQIQLTSPKRCDGCYTCVSLKSRSDP